MNAIRKQEEKHTPEPWACTKAGPVMNGYSQGDAICSIEHNTLIAGCFSDVRGGPEVAEYNARRIVACVNACSGLPTEELERIATRAPFTAYAELKQQRDELLEALKFAQMLLADNGITSSVVDKAIAKAANSR